MEYLEESPISATALAARQRSRDAQLVEELRQGDAEAGRRFVREYYQGVYRYLLYLTGDPEMAEDLTQETFVRAWRGLATLERRVRLRPWLHRIAHRELLQALRNRRTITRGSGAATCSLENVGELPGPASGSSTRTAELRILIDSLPIGEREMVVLHYLEGYSSEEIAEILGVPAGTVRYRLHAARARLRRELEEEEVESSSGGGG